MRSYVFGIAIKSALLSCGFVHCCAAGDATFSNDGERIFAICDDDNAAICELNLMNYTFRKNSFPQLPDQTWLRGIARSGDKAILCVTNETLWSFDPDSKELTKIRDAPEGTKFSNIAYDPNSHANFITGGTDNPLLRLKNGGREFEEIDVRRHPFIGCPVFARDGELFFSEYGDLWRGEIYNDSLGRGSGAQRIPIRSACNTRDS